MSANGDIVGRTIALADELWEIVATVAWSDGYVELRRGDESIVRPAAVVRRALEIDATRAVEPSPPVGQLALM